MNAISAPRPAKVRTQSTLPPIGAASGSLAINNPRKTLEGFPLSGLDFVEWHPSEGWEQAVETLGLKTLSIHLPKGGPQKHTKIMGYLDYMAQVDSAARIGAVLHPDQGYDWDIFGDGALICIENLDATRPGYQTPEDLHKFFQRLPKARFCFDVAHAFAVDASGKLAHELVAAFGDKISHLHLSHVEANGRHCEMRPEHCLRYQPVLERVNPVPVVMEPDINMQPDVLQAQHALLAEWLPW